MTLRDVLRTAYEQRVRNAWLNRCWRCVLWPFHGRARRRWR